MIFLIRIYLGFIIAVTSYLLFDYILDCKPEEYMFIKIAIAFSFGYLLDTVW
jgi:hypothetical protein